MRQAAIGLLAVVVTGCAGAPAATPSAGKAAETSASLAGRWIVDLSVPGGPPYTKAMELELAPDGSVTGSFYDSEIQAGRWKTDRGRICVSFRTTDGAGPYHTAACSVGSKRGQLQVEGQTWAEHRTFLFNWNAVRKQDS